MPSHNDFAKRFKSAVERNFDESVGVYDSFEEKHRLFETLTQRLCELNAPFSPARVLDVGCGTGISTLSIHRSLPRPPLIYALDISEPMLVKARDRCRNIEGIYFIRGDAEHLAEYFHEAFDAVFYTASIFLLPNFRESVAQACRLLLPGGVLAISFYDGLFDKDGNDAVQLAYPGSKYQYGAVPYADLASFLGSVPGFRLADFDYRFEVGEEFLFDFLSIPAQSAGVFPKLPYIERIPRIREWCSKLAGHVRPLFMGWKFLVSRKEE